MTMKRINITLDEETLRSLDVIGSEYGMNRSEAIRFLVDAADELNMFEKLQRIGAQLYEEKHGIEPKAKVSTSMMMKAAAECTIFWDER